MSFPPIGLDTAALLSVETDARAPDGAADGDPRGWWGDAFDDTGAGPIGSRLWLVLDGGKASKLATAQGEQALADSLKWLVRADQLSGLDVSSSVAAGGRVDLRASAIRSDGSSFEVTPGA